jgi:hypothetical protein
MINVPKEWLLARVIVFETGRRLNGELGGEFD